MSSTNQAVPGGNPELLTTTEIASLDAILHGSRPVDPDLARSILAFARTRSYGGGAGAGEVEYWEDDGHLVNAPWPLDWTDYHARVGVPAPHPSPRVPASTLSLILEAGPPDVGINRAAVMVAGPGVERRSVVMAAGWAIWNTVMQPRGVDLGDLDRVHWSAPKYNHLDVLVAALRAAVGSRVPRASALDLLHLEGIDLTAPTLGRRILAWHAWTQA